MTEVTKLAALRAKASLASPAVTSSPASGAATNCRRTPAVHCRPLAATSARSETSRGTTAFERGENDAVPSPSRRLTANRSGKRREDHQQDGGRRSKKIEGHQEPSGWQPVNDRLSQEPAADQPDAFRKHHGPDSGWGMGESEDKQRQRGEVQGVAGPADHGCQPEAAVSLTR